jgi:hypothetical protein
MKLSKREPKHMGEVMSDIAERYDKLTKTKMSKEIYAMIKGEKVVLGNVNSKKQFTFREDIDMSIVSKKTMERLEDVYEILKPKQR